MQQKNTEVANNIKTRVFIASFLAKASFGFVLAMFSIVKDKLNKQLHVQTSFLSYLDSFLYGGLILGSLYVLLYPSKEPKKAFFLSCAFLALFQLLLPLAKFIGPNGKYLMLVGMGGTGICKAFAVIPFLIMSQFFQQQSDKPKITIWNGLGNLGDTFGIFFSYFTIYMVRLRWDISYQICIFMYFLTALLFYLVVEQKRFNETDQQNINENMGANNIEQNRIQNQDRIINDIMSNYSGYSQQQQAKSPHSICHKIQKTSQLIKLFCHKPTNVLWCIDFTIQDTFNHYIVFWFPFYFVQNGFGTTTIYIVIAYYLSNVVGTLVFQNWIKKINFNLKYICSGLLVIQCAVLSFATFYLKNDSSHSIFYIMMATSIGFLGGGVFNQVCTVDFIETVGPNKQLKFSSYFFARLIQYIFNILMNTLIGFMMEKSLLRSKMALLYYDWNICTFCDSLQYQEILWGTNR